MQETNQKKFLSYYDQFKDKIFNYFWYRVGFNRPLAEDLTSEVFLKALKNFTSYDEARPFQAWIYAVAKNHLLNYYRTANRETDLRLAENLGGGELAKIENKLELEKVFAVINRLDSYYREVLMLRFADGFDNREIAEIIGKDEGAVRTQVSRAMEELRKHITHPPATPERSDGGRVTHNT
jgi:RNA polymerase sigma-70 factor (ECF subfamily)